MTMTATTGCLYGIAQADRELSMKPLRETVNKAVGLVFFNTMLRQARESSIKGEYGHGGYGEEVFQAQFDQVISERLGEASQTGLADAVIKRVGEQHLRMMQSRNTQQNVQMMETTA